MTNFIPELIEKAKNAKTTEELLAMAKENGVELTTEEANAYFAQLNPKSGELSDDELDNVAGGGCGNEQPTFSSGDRAKLRDTIVGYSGRCSSRSGTFYRDNSGWWLVCDTPECGCRIVWQPSHVVEASILDKI